MNDALGRGNGERALVTGALGSIGSAIVQKLLATGHRVIATDMTKASQDPSGVDEDTYAARLQLVLGDLTEASFIEELGELTRRVGGIEKIFCVAGIYPEKHIGELSFRDIARVFEINTFSAISLINTLSGNIKPGGSVVLFGSVAGSRGSRFHSLYAASKGALVSFAKSAALELGDKNIRVNTISPGVIQNPMTADLVRNTEASIMDSTALGRLGRPDEVANAAIFLGSESASFISGENLQVNGGLYM